MRVEGRANKIMIKFGDLSLFWHLIYSLNTHLTNVILPHTRLINIIIQVLFTIYLFLLKFEYRQILFWSNLTVDLYMYRCLLNLWIRYVPPGSKIILQKWISRFMRIFSSPEHEVLMVSYCGQWVVCRPSCVNIWCLHSWDHICDTIFMKLSQNVCFDNI